MGKPLSLSLPINLLNLFTCLSVTLVYLDSLNLLMKSVHFSIVVDVTKNANLDVHLSSLSVLSQRMAVIALTLSLSNCLSALCMICFAVLVFIVDLSLTLMELNPC